MEEPKPAQSTPSSTQNPDPNTAPSPPLSTEDPKPAQSTPPTQNPDPNSPQNLPPPPPQPLPSMEEPEPPQSTPPTQTQDLNPPNAAQNLPPPPSSMEESEPAQSTTPPTQTPIPNPPNTAQNLPPPHPHPPPHLPQNNKKRPLDQNGHIQNSKYFKMRAVLKDLRPHFIEVLRTPVFHNCKAADEIREQMKLLMDLYKEMTAETISPEKSKNVPEGHLSSEIQYGQKPREHHQYANKPVEQPPAPVLLGNLSEKQTHGTYIVGGSAFGWNFITYLGSKTVYYGRTKEMFRSANAIPQETPI